MMLARTVTELPTRLSQYRITGGPAICTAPALTPEKRPTPMVTGKLGCA